MTLNEAIKHCEEIACKHNECALEHQQLANWLKELKNLKENKPKSQWKPSEEQMTALRRMKAAIAGEGEIYKPLNSLYEDLKKLKEK